jgi:lipoyl(octanoyl) transferase
VVDYLTAWEEQRRLHGAVAAATASDTVLLLEHPSVYTAGKREPFDRPVDGHRSSTSIVVITGLDPQLVGYPIVRLNDPTTVAYVRKWSRY